jgi:hypothetical protein
MNIKITKKTNAFTVVKDKNIFDIINSRIEAANNGSTVLVPHVCNNVNAFGAGFAGQVAEIYPEVKANFHLLGKNAKLGQSQFVAVKTDKLYKHQIIFANMIAQNSLISSQNTRPLNYGALVYAMFDVRSYVKKLEQKLETTKIEIHAPKFGSGLAGGNWNFVSNLIEDIWYDIPVYIYIYK